MYIIILYLVSCVVWSLIANELLSAVRFSVKNKTKAPKLVLPMLISSIAIAGDSIYSLAARIARHFIGIDAYMAFTDEQYVFLVKIFIALSGIFILMRMKKDRE